MGASESETIMGSAESKVLDVDLDLQEAIEDEDQGIEAMTISPEMIEEEGPEAEVITDQGEEVNLEGMQEEKIALIEEKKGSEKDGMTIEKIETAEMIEKGESQGVMIEKGETIGIEKTTEGTIEIGGVVAREETTDTEKIEIEEKAIEKKELLIEEMADSEMIEEESQGATSKIEGKIIVERRIGTIEEIPTEGMIEIDGTTEGEKRDELVNFS